MQGFVKAMLACAFLAAAVAGGCSSIVDDGEAVEGKVIDSRTGQGIGGIEVTCLSIDGQPTDTDFTVAKQGQFRLLYDYDADCATLQFIDVDGEENGGVYAERFLLFDPDETGDLVVTLEPLDN